MHSGYEPDFETTYGNARMFAIEMSVESRACLKFKHLIVIVEQSDARERRIEVLHDSHRANL